MTTFVSQVWFVIAPDGTIRPQFTPSQGALGPYDLTYDAPQEVQDAADARAAQFAQDQEDRLNRRIEGSVSETAGASGGRR